MERLSQINVPVLVTEPPQVWQSFTLGLYFHSLILLQLRDIVAKNKTSIGGIWSKLAYPSTLVRVFS